MVRRRRTPAAGAPRNVHEPETAEMVPSTSLPPDSVETVPPHETSVHETLLESVSPEALQMHGDTPGDAVAATVPEAAVARHEPAADAPANSDLPNALTDLETAPPEPVGAMIPAPTAAVATEAWAANDSTPPDGRDAEPSPATVVVPARPAAGPVFRRASALDAIHEVSESNATVVAFLRNEGSATLAHWRSLTQAKSAADAVRLQVDEMQRAADASLTCINALAQRAGRFAKILTRR